MMVKTTLSPEVQLEELVATRRSLALELRETGSPEVKKRLSDVERRISDLLLAREREKLAQEGLLVRQRQEHERELERQHRAVLEQTRARAVRRQELVAHVDALLEELLETARESITLEDPGLPDGRDVLARYMSSRCSEVWPSRFSPDERLRGRSFVEVDGEVTNAFLSDPRYQVTDPV
jgi:hypothetical protein